jgi:hypothetical protein
MKRAREERSRKPGNPRVRWRWTHLAAVFRLTLKAAAAPFNVTFSIVIWLAKVSTTKA